MSATRELSPQEAGDRIHAAKQLLLVALGASLSELLAAAPVIGNVRAALPQTRLWFLTDRVGAPAVLDHPALEAVWIVPDSGWGASLERRLLARRINQHGFDAALSISAYPPNANAMSFLRGLKVGLLAGLDDVSENGTVRNETYDCVIPCPDEARNVVDHHLALLEGLGISIVDRMHHLEVTDRQRDRARALLAEAGLTEDRPVLGLLPGGAPRHPERQWPASSYAAVLQRAILELEYQVVLLGNTEDAPTLEAVQAFGKAAIPRLVDLPFEDVKAVLSELDFFITHDGDAVHMAAGVRVPSYVMFLSTPAWKWAPYGSHVAVWSEPDRVPTSAEVWGTVRPLLERTLAKRISAGL
jgi:ADP-heptose:LPS heptosyltransferase